MESRCFATVAVEPLAQHLLVPAGQPLGHRVGQAPLRRGLDRRLVRHPLDIADGDVLLRIEVVARRAAGWP